LNEVFAKQCSIMICLLCDIISSFLVFTVDGSQPFRVVQQSNFTERDSWSEASLEFVPFVNVELTLCRYIQMWACERRKYKCVKMHA
jgi:hypothetical protein